jgi:chemotaxis family two-component system response regulator Rcp1
MTELPVEILLVEDNPGDARLTMEAFKSARRPCRVRLVGDGLEAMAFLRREGLHGQAPRPHLILLDLNLPCKDGREVLAEIKADETLKRIPVVVLTTSRAELDVRRAYCLKANCYVSKPHDLEAFFRVIQGIEEFWLRTVSLPQG